MPTPIACLLLVAAAHLLLPSQAAPAHYRAMHATPAVQAKYKFNQMIRAQTTGRLLRQTDGVDCGKEVQGDPMWFTQNGCSIASVVFIQR